MHEKRTLSLQADDAAARTIVTIATTTEIMTLRLTQGRVQRQFIAYEERARLRGHRRAIWQITLSTNPFHERARPAVAANFRTIRVSRQLQIHSRFTGPGSSKQPHYETAILHHRAIYFDRETLTGLNLIVFDRARFISLRIGHNGLELLTLTGGRDFWSEVCFDNKQDFTQSDGNKRQGFRYGLAIQTTAITSPGRVFIQQRDWRRASNTPQRKQESQHHLNGTHHSKL